MEQSGPNVIVMDTETAHSAQECRHCGAIEAGHEQPYSLCRVQPDVEGDIVKYAPIGWKDHGALGLSIGCYYDYQDCQVHWFDVTTVGEVVKMVVERRPLVVSFNGRAFDSRLLWVVSHLEEDAQLEAAWRQLWEESYDILHEIWQVDGPGRFAKGNSLDSVAWATLSLRKTGHGALAPLLWQTEHYADVLNYCQNDVFLTKALFEHICQGQAVERVGLAPVTLRVPDVRWTASHGL